MAFQRKFQRQSDRHLPRRPAGGHQNGLAMTNRKRPFHDQGGERHGSWEHVSKWYGDLVGNEGPYYHQRIVIPGVLRLLNLKSKDQLLDIACGSGVLGRSIPQGVEYTGFDVSPALVEQAQKMDRERKHRYLIADATNPSSINSTTMGQFSHAAIVLALQNMPQPEKAIVIAAGALRKGGKLAIILNHPCFRIPRQTSWGIDEANKLEYRRINRYLSPIRIPINVHPSKYQQSPVVWSYHHSISDYAKFLADHTFSISAIEEWSSDKSSVGPAARMENRARAEFPLFLTILAEKKQ